VGPWRIVDRRGIGAHGAVYLAEGEEAAGRVALKLAQHPRNGRFDREAELLSRLRHPGVPRLIGRGEWVSPVGQPHPWLAMEWVEGIPLYAWGQAFRPSSRQVLRVLAGLARALEAAHAAGGVHRDVKGDNTLVRLSDGQPFLIDFGSGTYPGAAPLTGPVFPPGTPHYRSPEAYRFALHICEQLVKVYAPRQAEDVFALGVTAYKLVTDEYPPSPEPVDVRFHVWKTEGPGPQPAHELNRRCCGELSALISRMLSRQPEARGSARELARALEKAARKAGPEADAPLFAGGTRRGGGGEVPAAEVPRLSWKPWLAAAGFAGAMVALGAAWRLSTPDRVEHVPELVAEHQEETRDAGSVAVGDTVLTAPVASPHTPSAGTLIAMEVPPKPMPGQVRPNAQGRCPFKNLVIINGGCWMKVDDDSEDCTGTENGFVYQGACYMPAMKPLPPATSNPPESRDGGD
jgi:serine/threonine-protein kinase